MARIGRRMTGKKIRQKMRQEEGQRVSRDSGAHAAETSRRALKAEAVGAGPVIEAERRPILEKLINIDEEQYRIQGSSVRELQENERLLRIQLADSQANGLTLNRYFEGWIAHRRKTAAKPATPFRYQQLYNNHMRDSIGCRKLREINRQDLLQFQTQLLEHVSAGTVNYLFQLLKQILNDAQADEIISKNPANNVKRLKTSGAHAVETNHRALTEEETRTFLDAVRDTFYYEYFAFLLLTGLRQGEASTLTWGDVDDGEGVFHVRRTLTFDADGHVVTGPPKSDAGIRDIPMNESIRKVLDAQREKVEEKWGKWALEKGAKVFPSSIGRTLHNATVNQAIGRALKRLDEQGNGIEHFSCHALRDTFATRFIEAGGNPQTLKTLLGHSTLAMTMDLYAHVMPSTKQKEMDMVQLDV